MSCAGKQETVEEKTNVSVSLDGVELEWVVDSSLPKGAHSQERNLDFLFGVENCCNNLSGGIYRILLRKVPSFIGKMGASRGQELESLHLFFIHTSTLSRT